jgi:hypothetical protein
MIRVTQNLKQKRKIKAIPCGSISRRTLYGAPIWPSSGTRYKGTAPFDFAAVQAGEDLDEIADSLRRLEKKGQQ